MTAQLETLAKELEDRADAERDARRRAKLTEAVTRATEVLNAFTEHEHRLFQVGASARRRGHVDEASEITAPRLDLEIEPGDEPTQERERRSGKEQVPPLAGELIPVTFGSGRLRFRSQVFQVEIRGLGPGAAECEIYRDRGLLVVNSDHPSYEEAERGGWTEGIVLRAVATRLACDESSTAGEV